MTNQHDAPTIDDKTWIKPTLEKLPLDAALTGPNPNFGVNDGTITYPS